MSVGSIVAARIISHYDDWMMSGGALFALPSRFATVLKKNRDMFPSESFYMANGCVSVFNQSRVDKAQVPGISIC